MIYPKHNPLYINFFKWYTRVMLALDFRQVIIKNPVNIKNQAVLLIGNHFSWWDGFFAYYLNMKVIHKKFHVMMLEEQLKGRKFLNNTGAFSINKKRTDMINSLNYTAELLNNQDNMVLFYPQGAFNSLYKRPVIFESGIKKILQKCQANVQVIFYVALIDYFEHRKPTLSLYLKGLDYDSSLTASCIQDKFNIFLNDSIQQQESLKRNFINQ